MKGAIVLHSLNLDNLILTLVEIVIREEVELPGAVDGIA